MCVKTNTSCLKVSSPSACKVARLDTRPTKTNPWGMFVLKVHFNDFSGCIIAAYIKYCKVSQIKTTFSRKRFEEQESNSYHLLSPSSASSHHHCHNHHYLRKQQRLVLSHCQYWNEFLNELTFIVGDIFPFCQINLGVWMKAVPSAERTGIESASGKTITVVRNAPQATLEWREWRKQKFVIVSTVKPRPTTTPLIWPPRQ